jgi:hypothetical protein
MFKKKICLLLFTFLYFVTISCGENPKNIRTDWDWEAFKKFYHKSYKNRFEDLRRFEIWKKNMEFINGHNRQNLNGSYRCDMNQFGDLTRDEFLRVVRGFDKRLFLGRKSKKLILFTPSKAKKIPAQFGKDIFDISFIKLLK